MLPELCRERFLSMPQDSKKIFGYQDFMKIEFRIRPTNMCGLFYKNYMGTIYNNNNSSSNQLFFVEET